MPTLITDAFQRTARARGSAPALRHRRNGSWTTVAWTEYHDAVRRAAKALIALGVEAGEHVTIIGANRPEWFIADIAAIAAGAIPAGIYNTSSAEQCRYVAEHCEARVAFVENAEQLEKFRAIRPELPKLRAIVVMDDEVDASASGAAKPGEWLSWDAFLALGDAVAESDLDARIGAQRVDDVCTLIYTSGTTGTPKAVMLSHGNLSSVVEQAAALVDIAPGDDVVSYLPLSHIAEQLFSLHNSAMLGTCTWFCADVESLGDVLRDARPHHFLAVPRVWEKIQAKMEVAGANAPWLRRRIVRWARGVGLAAGHAMQVGRKPTVSYRLADRLVFTKVRAALGFDRAKLMLTGAAPISRSTLEFFLSLGLPVCEVYGMSECTGVATGSVPGRLRTGTAGFIPSTMQLKVAPDGEICIRGPHVFKGYYKDSSATAEVMDDDGWLHSGDIGQLDADGFLTITDRKKDILITAGGENVAPQMIEGHLKSIGVVSQAVVIGDRRRYLAALLTLDAEKIASVASTVGSAARTCEEAAVCARFNSYLQREIDTVNARLSRVQTVKRFAVLPPELTIDGGELTPTLKLRRKAIVEKHAAVIERLYGS
ncbi:MAG TPA: AMP-binding protein [Gemmatimonadaceae bacterium]|jgi:long-subunit acyl-CoA synthetase (AMP-forming)